MLWRDEKLGYKAQDINVNADYFCYGISNILVRNEDFLVIIDWPCPVKPNIDGATTIYISIRALPTSVKTNFYFNLHVLIE